MHFKNKVLTDKLTRSIYSVDASIYEVEPAGVAVPKTVQELQEVVKEAVEKGLSVTARGAATGIAGGCIGEGIVIDVSTHINRILEINIEEEYAVVEPGVVQDELNSALGPHGYRLGPNTSTGNRATIGGMVANNAAGSHSLLYGQMGDHLQEIDLILSSGETVTLKPLALQEWKEKGDPLHQSLWRLREEYQEEINQHFPKMRRRASGYNLDELVRDDGFNPCRLIAGSEGTLGIITRIQVKICPKEKKRSLTLFQFDNFIEAMEAISPLLATSPNAIEMIDRDIIEMGKRSPMMEGKLGWLKGDPAALLVVEHSEDQEVGGEKLDDEETVEQIWSLRQAGLELLLSKRSYQRAVAFIEDMAVPPENLPSFMKEFLTYLENVGKKAGIYGHVSVGCLHIRPYFNLREASELALMQTMMKEMAKLVRKYDGVMSSEHGDGLVRTWLNPLVFGDKLYEAFEKVKASFDPAGKMNPYKVVDGPPPNENLRLDPNSGLKEFDTFQCFEDEGGFALSADLCNGNGLCRKKEGVMCPSFQATLREMDSTRARAQVLRSIIHGRSTPQSLDHPALLEVLDLCLSCKGCKKECPSQVDMAKMKAEALYHSHQKTGVPIRSRLFGAIGTLNKWGAKFSFLFNGLSPLAKPLMGIAKERSLPKVHFQTFTKRFQTIAQNERRKQVVLFNDTFTEHNHPEIGIAAVNVLHHLGYQVFLPEYSCCGRPNLSKGLLRQAKKQALKLIDTLYPFAERGIPIVGLEPSCILTIKDDFPSLAKEEKEKAKIIAGKCQTISRFLEAHRDLFPKVEQKETFLLHGHCHQKAIEGTKSAINVLSHFGKVSEIPTGCCGMAGSFGYEKEHFSLSMEIGNLALFPEVKKAVEETLVADGFSCRTQIKDGTGRSSSHLIQVVDRYIQS